MTSQISKANKSASRLRVAVWIGLSDKKCLEKLRGLDGCDLVGEGILFRQHPVQGLKKFKQICPPRIFRSSAAASHLYAAFATIPRCLAFRPQVCIGISFMPHSVLAKVGQLVTGAKYITWLIGTDMHVNLAKKWWGRLFKRAISSADCTMTMGNGSNKKLEIMGWSSRSLVVGRNDYNLSNYQEDSSEKEWDIIYTGRLDREHKRVGLLLEAVSVVRRSRPSVRCAIVGEGPDRGRLENICKSLELESQVAFLGHRSDIPNLLNRSHILVMTSAWEGLPTSIVEAFVLGLPVVSADVVDVSDIVVDGKNGILVKSDSPAAYAEAILSILESQETYQRLSLCARETGKRIRRETEEGISAERWRQALERSDSTL